MKGCALSCLTGLIGYLAAIGVIFLWLNSLGARRDDALGVAAGVGFLVTMSISFLWSAVTVKGNGRLLRNALEGVPPVDGKWAGFSGVIQARTPIVSPMSGRPAVAFKYDVWRTEGSGKTSSRVTYYKGTALAPSTISTNLGTYKLMAVPQFDMAHSDVSQLDARHNMRAYMERTEFETRKHGQTKQHTSLHDEWADDDGNFRLDVKYDPAPEVEESCRFDEQMIEQGESICLMGLYSQMKGGIIPDPNWAKQTLVVKGDGEAGVRALEKRSRRYVIIGLVIGAVSAAILWHVVSGLPVAT